MARAFALAALLLVAGCAREQRPEAWFGVGPSSGAHAWFQELRTLYPDLSQASFHLSGSDPLQAGGEPWLQLWDDGALPGMVAVQKSLAEMSPNGLRAVSLYWENLSEYEEGWEPGGNPDSYITVLSTDTWTGAPAFTCGTPCRFHAAGWAGNDSVVVVGTYEDPPDVVHLEAGVLELGKGLVHWYHGPEVPAEMGIGARWWSWLKRRHPEIRWAVANNGPP